MSVRTLAAARVRARILAGELKHRIRTKHGNYTPAEVVMAFAQIAAEFDAEFNGKADPRGLQDFLIVLLGGPESINWNRLNKLPEAEVDSLTDIGGALMGVVERGNAGDAL